MTESEWLTLPEPESLVRFVSQHTSVRKLRLFCVACCERVEHLFTDARSHSALACARRYADLCADAVELALERDAAHAAWVAAVRHAGNAIYGIETFGRLCRTASTGLGIVDEVTLSDSAASAADAVTCTCALELDVSRTNTGVLRQVARATELAGGSEARAEELLAQCRLLRDVFGNSFWSVAVEPTWLTETVVRLAGQMYGSRDFSAMPILADALQDAGCENDDVLTHCRRDAEHVRGCWVVDLLLSKT